mmetsp:Transcript_106965/g.330444  ORF Transcript_106965/g.330444 Transcript_106965/m.330444 type:complete len:630 (+) Transcript_106965:151-2040(+)
MTPFSLQRHPALSAVPSIVLLAELTSSVLAVGLEGRAGRGVVEVQPDGTAKAQALDLTSNSSPGERPVRNGLLRRESSPEAIGPSPTPAPLPLDLEITDGAELSTLTAVEEEDLAAVDAMQSQREAEEAVRATLAPASEEKQVLQEHGVTTTVPWEGQKEQEAAEAESRQEEIQKEGEHEIEEIKSEAAKEAKDPQEQSEVVKEEEKERLAEAHAEAEHQREHDELEREQEKVGAQTAGKEIFDCDEAFNEWKFGWSAAKREWCCRYKQRGCPRLEGQEEEQEHKEGSQNPTGEEVCEGQGWSQHACLSLGCCNYDYATSICFSAVGRKPCSVVHSAPIPLAERLRKRLQDGPAPDDESRLNDVMKNKRDHPSVVVPPAAAPAPPPPPPPPAPAPSSPVVVISPPAPKPETAPQMIIAPTTAAMPQQAGTTVQPGLVIVSTSPETGQAQPLAPAAGPGTSGFATSPGGEVIVVENPTTAPTSPPPPPAPAEPETIVIVEPTPEPTPLPPPPPPPPAPIVVVPPAPETPAPTEPPPPPPAPVIVVPQPAQEAPLPAPAPPPPPPPEPIVVVAPAPEAPPPAPPPPAAPPAPIIVEPASAGGSGALVAATPSTAPASFASATPAMLQRRLR